MLERGGKRRKGQNLPGADEGGPAGILRAEWKGCSGQVAFWSTDPTDTSPGPTSRTLLVPPLSRGWNLCTWPQEWRVKCKPYPLTSGEGLVGNSPEARAMVGISPLLCPGPDSTLPLPARDRGRHWTGPSQTLGERGSQRLINMYLGDHICWQIFIFLMILKERNHLVLAPSTDQRKDILI